MSYQVPARKWRPRNFDEVLGQAHVVRALCNALDLGRLHHAYLFTGTRGVGKTTIARILAKCLNCETGVAAKPCGECAACKQIDEGRFVDLIEIDAASRTGVDNMRELLEDVNYTPGAGRFKIYLIDEVHMLSISSFNALLKTLEEPPDHVKFFFATTHPQKLPVTILSRCLQFNLTRLLPGEIEEYLAGKLKDENVPYEDAALKQIAIAAEGSVRDSLSLLDQAIAYGNGSLKTEEVETMLGLAAREEVTGLLHCITGGDAAKLLESIENMYRKAVNFTAVLDNLIELLHAVAVQQAVPGVEPPAQFDAGEITALAAATAPEDTQLFYQIALNGKRDLPFLPDARNAFEMTMLRMLSFRFAEDAQANLPAAQTQPSTSAQAPARTPARTPAQAPAQAPARTPAQAATSPQPSPKPTPAQAATSPQLSPKPTPAQAAASSQPPPAPTPAQAAASSQPPPAPTPAQAATSSQPPPAPTPAQTATPPQPSPAPTSAQAPAPENNAGDATPPLEENTGVETPPATGNGGAQAVDLTDFTTPDGWLELIGRMQLAGARHQICVNSVFSAQSSREVTLAFDKSLEQIKTPEREKKIRDALSRIAGADVKVHFKPASPDEETPEQAKQRKRLERQRAAEQSITEDAVVQSLQSQFEASIVPGSTKPVEDPGSGK